MFQIDIDFDAIREKLYDVVDAVLEKGLHLEDKINTFGSSLYDGPTVNFDIESHKF